MIPQDALYRLLRNTYAPDGDGDGEATFERWMRDGFALLPAIDFEDKATIARILAGERWEESGPRAGGAAASTWRPPPVGPVIGTPTAPSGLYRCPACSQTVRLAENGVVLPHLDYEGFDGAWVRP